MKKLKVGYLVTARLKSQRLKNKLLLRIRGKTIITHLIDRLKLSKNIDEIIICTSIDIKDRPLIKIAKANGVKCFLGEELDVIKRLYDAAVYFKLDYIVNVTADCPFVDPNYADHIVNEYKKSKADLIRQFDLPHGAFSYGIKINALKKIIQIKNSENTEVWGNYFLNTGYFKVIDLPVKNIKHRRPDIRMTLDYPEDFEFFKLIFNKLYKKNKVFSLSQIIDLLNKNPDIININKHCTGKFKKRFSDQSNISLKQLFKVNSSLVIGCGSIGKRHIKNLSFLNIRKIYAKRSHKGFTKNLPKKLHVIEYNTWKETLSKDYDLAIISNPSSLHLETTKKLIDNVKGIFIEKPVSHNLRGCNKLIQILIKKNIVTFVGNNLLFHPIITQTKKFIEKNDLGNLISMQIQAGQYLPYWHPKENYKESYFSRKDLGGGVLLTLIHEIQLANHFLGKPLEVSCFLNHDPLLGIDVETSADLTIRHTNDFISQIHIDYLQKESHRSGLLTFDNGWIAYDFNLNKVTARLKEKKMKTIWNDHKYEYNQMYINELKHFISLTQQRQIQHDYDLYSSIDSLKVVEAAKQSNRNKTIVKIEQDKSNNFFR